ncbi:hypothetical protein GCM10023353_27970 [Tomitella cavernea]|uniref:Uncharacterized protein n=1 Tax=Tomitella cavernea TaxID=1387982 RepID=A0ABP9CVB7_9ACTN
MDFVSSGCRCASAVHEPGDESSREGAGLVAIAGGAHVGVTAGAADHMDEPEVDYDKDMTVLPGPVVIADGHLRRASSHLERYDFAGRLQHPLYPSGSGPVGMLELRHDGCPELVVAVGTAT